MAATQGRIADLRREVQMAFGASLLGLVTASCVPEPRMAQAATPKSVPPLHDGAEDAPGRGRGAEVVGESALKPADTGTKQASDPNVGARPAGTVVAIYGSSSVSIHDKVEYTRHSLVIDAEGERTLAALKELLDAFDCDILIQGHAGGDEANAAEWLSKRRAELVRERLIALGVEGRRLSVEVPSRVANAAAPGRARVSFLFHASANSSRRSCDESDRRAR